MVFATSQTLSTCAFATTGAKPALNSEIVVKIAASERAERARYMRTIVACRFLSTGTIHLCCEYVSRRISYYMWDVSSSCKVGAVEAPA